MYTHILYTCIYIYIHIYTYIHTYIHIYIYIYDDDDEWCLIYSWICWRACLLLVNPADFFSGNDWDFVSHYFGARQIQIWEKMGWNSSLLHRLEKKTTYSTQFRSMLSFFTWWNYLLQCVLPIFGTNSSEWNIQNQAVLKFRNPSKCGCADLDRTKTK